jgi:hypothetical protein
MQKTGPPKKFIHHKPKKVTANNAMATPTVLHFIISKEGHKMCEEVCFPPVQVLFSYQSTVHSFAMHILYFIF